ncbi:YppG family protein [Bacillus sp. 03113]|uniref:YppG family protein n=1 Tax=Bacillus sp. 03113 TaxID=2578211 RepID=UPI00215C3084|nr:YppG family protein [Bacillus sp. 03113]
MFGRKRMFSSRPEQFSYRNQYRPQINNYSNYYPYHFREQPYPGMGGMSYWSYQGQIPYSPYLQKEPFPQQSIYQTPYQYPQNVNQYAFQSNQHSVFHNPLQPKEEPIQNKYQQEPVGGGYPYMNPYPKPSFLPKQPSGMQSIMNSFKTQEGSFDFNKVMDTAGMMMNAVNQVSGLVKGFGGFFKA